MRYLADRRINGMIVKGRIGKMKIFVSTVVTALLTSGWWFIYTVLNNSNSALWIFLVTGVIVLTILWAVVIFNEVSEKWDR
jgi:hypothetical protein